MFPYTATVGFLARNKKVRIYEKIMGASRTCLPTPTLSTSWSVLQCSCSQFVWRAHWYNPIAT